MSSIYCKHSSKRQACLGIFCFNLCRKPTANQVKPPASKRRMLPGHFWLFKISQPSLLKGMMCINFHREEKREREPLTIGFCQANKERKCHYCQAGYGPKFSFRLSIPVSLSRPLSPTLSSLSLSSLPLSVCAFYSWQKPTLMIWKEGSFSSIIHHFESWLVFCFFTRDSRHPLCHRRPRRRLGGMLGPIMHCNINEGVSLLMHSYISMMQHCANTRAELFINS